MTAELQSRLIFIDTSAFEQKNFQFDAHKLEQLCNLLSENKLHLLTTDITINEVKKHLKNKSKESVSLVKRIKKEAMFLRNTPTLSCYGIFSDVNEDEIYEMVSNAFDTFLELSGAEVVPINTVDISVVFDNYFNERPPFSGPNKKSEFPDAFVLEAVRMVSQQRGHKLYVISCDGDMAAYAQQYDDVLHLNSVDELIDLVIRNEDELKQPVAFADKIFSHLERSLIGEIRNKLLEMEFYPESDHMFDIDVDNIEVDYISIIDKRILEVSSTHAQYEVNLGIKVTAYYSVVNYDESPWDSEDKEYIYLVTDELVVVHNQEISVYVNLDYDDAIKERADIVDIEFADSIISLDIDEGEILHSRSNKWDQYEE